MQHLKSRGITSLTLPGYYSDCRHVSSVVLVVVICYITLYEHNFSWK